MSLAGWAGTEAVGVWYPGGGGRVELGMDLYSEVQCINEDNTFLQLRWQAVTMDLFQITNIPMVKNCGVIIRLILFGIKLNRSICSTAWLYSSLRNYLIKIPRVLVLFRNIITVGLGCIDRNSGTCQEFDVDEVIEVSFQILCCLNVKTKRICG